MKKKPLEKILEVYTVIVFATMLLLTFANVVSRYLLHASIAFTDEITSNLFVSLTVFGAAIAQRRGAHLGLTILTDHFSPRGQAWCGVFAGICGMIFSAVCIYSGVKMCINNIDRSMISLSLQIPTVIWSAQLPIGMFFVFLSFAESTINALKRALSKEKDLVAEEGVKKEDLI